ncbi:MAG: hypothetical protein JW754_02125 [Candidatus Aenigmarchaeota archaeon]|nr:hypothetical protein [Candidatus Aenigmarchaeota archaeon]
MVFEDQAAGYILGLFGASLGFLIGGSFTYYINKRLQEKDWKRELNERIYYPLLDELHRIRDYYLMGYKTDIDLTEWDRIKSEHLHYQIDRKIGEIINDFFVIKFHNFIVSVNAANRRIKEIVEKELMEVFEFDKKFIWHYKEGGFSINNTQVSSFIEAFSSMLLCKDKIGCPGSNPNDFVQANNNYEHIKKHYEDLFSKKAKFQKMEEFLHFMWEKTKEEGIIKSTRKKQKGVIKEINDLINEIKKIVRI